MTIYNVIDDKILMWPFATYTDEEERVIEKLWKLSGGKYIVDPIGSSQCTVAMYNEILWIFKLCFRILFGKVQYKDLTLEQYQNHKY